MLVAPDLEIIDLIETEYDEEGNFIREKISEDATPRQKELFEQYLKELEYARSRTIIFKK